MALDRRRYYKRVLSTVLFVLAGAVVLVYALTTEVIVPPPKEEKFVKQEVYLKEPELTEIKTGLVGRYLTFESSYERVVLDLVDMTYNITYDTSIENGTAPLIPYRDSITWQELIEYGSPVAMMQVPPENTRIYVSVLDFQGYLCIEPMGASEVKLVFIEDWWGSAGARDLGDFIGGLYLRNNSLFIVVYWAKGMATHRVSIDDRLLYEKAGGETVGKYDADRNCYIPAYITREIITIKEVTVVNETIVRSIPYVATDAVNNLKLLVLVAVGVIFTESAWFAYNIIQDYRREKRRVIAKQDSH